MLNFKSTLVNTTRPSSQVHQNPNLDQLNNSMYYRISNYLMSDEDPDESFEKNLVSMDKDIDVILHDNVFINNVGGSSNSLEHNIKYRRESKKYNHTREELRFAFRTKTVLEVMDDGYKWRKYGKKMMKNSPNPRNYFKCSNEGCRVKKRVERECDDPSYVITTYQGVHNHAS